MRILIFSRTFNGVVGGVEKMVFRLAEELTNRKHKVIIVSIDEPGARPFYPLPNGVVWEKINLGDPDVKATFTIRIRRVLALRKLLRMYEIQTAIGFQIGAFALLRLASLGMNIRNVAAERNAPTLFDFIKHGKSRRFLANMILSSSSCITVQMESYKNLYPAILWNRIYHTPNPILSAGEIKTVSSVQCKMLRILYVGRLTFQKNLEVLLEAIPLSNVSIELTIVGDGESKETLQNLALRNDLRVVFIAPTNQLDQFYLAADLFCIPSRWEGFPNVVGEALAHGLPVVAFKGCAGMSDLVIDGVNGLLAEGNSDPISLSIALRSAWSLSWNPQKSVESCNLYSLERFTDRWEAAIGVEKVRSNL
jgi:glycosyltransferase involved in cell wall biosynthesis